MTLYIIYQVQMHQNVTKETHFDAKKDLRNHPTLSKRANPNIGILLLLLVISVCFSNHSISAFFFVCAHFCFAFPSICVYIVTCVVSKWVIAMFSDILTIDCLHSRQALTTQKASGHTSDRRKTCHSLSSKQTETGKNQFSSSSQLWIFSNEISIVTQISSVFLATITTAAATTKANLVFNRFNQQSSKEETLKFIRFRWEKEEFLFSLNFKIKKSIFVPCTGLLSSQ